MRIGQKLISNTVYLFLDWFAISILSFIFWFSLGKTLAKQELGTVSTIINFTVLFSWISFLGITLALQKMIPEFKKKDSKRLYALIRISLKPILIALTVIILSIFIFSNQISSILKVPQEGMIISIFSMLAIVPFTFFGSILYGFQNMKRFFLTDFFQALFKLSISILLIYLGFRAYGPLIGFGMGYFIAMLMRLDLKYFKGKDSSFSYKELFVYASPALVSTMASLVMTNSQYIILSILKNPGVTGIFTIAFLLTSFIGVLVNVLASALFPIISGLSVDRRMKVREGYLIGVVMRYSLMVIVPISVVFLIFSNLFVLSFSSIEYISATTYFPILIPAAIMFGIGSIFNSNLYAIGKPKISRNIIVLTALLFLATSIPSVQYFSAVGLSVAYLISMAFYFVLNLTYIRKFLKIKFFVKGILKILISSGFIGFVLLLLYPLVSNIIMLAAVSIFSIIIYLLLLLPLKFYINEDIRILEFFSKRIPVLNKFLLAIIDLLKKF